MGGNDLLGLFIAIELHWFDAGHGSLYIEEQIAHQETMLRFAYRVLGE